ncbi:hypothetical protein [Cellulomonas sp. PS-H5]|uniref:hypothetical protein n=1 Tax=Cellulomonas sp. PS-H5 TaxID=2820400 RepID=UPI001C4E93B0|nr:hypothetical protein [Cellulomonas sp. PS-H5]MBW0253904.1 hypothetical protein [Cellulomonas sp. PS-H5]
MSVRQRVMSVLTLAGCLFGVVGIPLGWGAHEPARFCATAADCPDLRWSAVLGDPGAVDTAVPPAAAAAPVVP